MLDVKVDLDISSAGEGLANKMNFAPWSGSTESALEVGCLRHSGTSASQVSGLEQPAVLYERGCQPFL